MLKFILKKKSDGSQLEVASFATTGEGDAWVARITGPGTYGHGDLSLKIDELAGYGLTQEQATSSQEIEGETIYFFAKEWEVEVVDITADVEQAAKVQDRSESRQKCLAVVDFIASYNKDEATPQQMSAIFSNAAFVGIVLALLTGAPRTAEALVSQHGPSLYPQVMVDKVLAMLGAIE
jgi:hypothetical protein